MWGHLHFSDSFKSVAFFFFFLGVCFAAFGTVFTVFTMDFTITADLSFVKLTSAMSPFRDLALFYNLKWDIRCKEKKVCDGSCTNPIVNSSITDVHIYTYINIYTVYVYLSLILVHYFFCNAKPLT